MLGGIKPGSHAVKLRDAAEEKYARAAEVSGADGAALAADATETARQSGLAESYHYLQLLAGAVAVSFPVVLIVGHLVARTYDKGVRAVEPSLSHYYYTRLGNFFVGALCALGLFFLSYQRKPLPGYEWDNRITTFAGFMAFGVALLPTAFDSATAEGSELVVYGLHLLSAMALFVSLGVLAWARFTLSGPEPPQTTVGGSIRRVLMFWTTDPYDEQLTPQQKRARNLVYRWCARTIFLMLALLGLNFATRFLDGIPVFGEYSLLMAEIICVWAFGLAWLVKAEVFSFLNDPPPS